LWRGLTGASVALSALLAVLLVGRPDAGVGKPQYMVVLVAPQDKEPGYVMQASMGRKLNLVPLHAAPVPADKSLQFWTKADGWKGPVSLGLVKPGQTITIPLDALPNVQPNQLFELTLEPAKGSPLNKPTGPIQFIGRAVKVM
jgi:anti-sigma-K factor RskA